MFDSGAPEGVYRLRVVPAQISPLIWRRLEVTGATTLAGLHEVFQTAFGWDGDYLYAFTVHGVDYGTVSSWHRRAGDVRLVDLGLRERERFAYGYNFFDGWYTTCGWSRSARPNPAAATHAVWAAPARCHPTAATAQPRICNCAASGFRR